MIMLVVVVAVIALLLVQHLLRQRRQQRLQYLQKYPFHSAYFSALQADYPRLGKAELLLADDALRQFFIMHWRYPKLGLNMPSKLADALWHAFILDTRRYEVFCKKAFGHTFHHIPTFETAAATAGTRRSQLQATWSAAMRTKHLLPRALIAGVPVLFALDGHAQIDDGMHTPCATWPTGPRKCGPMRAIARAAAAALVVIPAARAAPARLAATATADRMAIAAAVLGMIELH